MKRIMLIDDDPDDQLFFRDAVQTIRPGLDMRTGVDLPGGFQATGKTTPAGFYIHGLKYAGNEWL